MRYGALRKNENACPLNFKKIYPSMTPEVVLEQCCKILTRRVSFIILDKNLLENCRELLISIKL